MKWCNIISNPCTIINNTNSDNMLGSEKPSSSNTTIDGGLMLGSNIKPIHTLSCPSCGHHLPLHNQQGAGGLNELPAGVKFDPTDPEILEHLEAKVRSDFTKLHPLLPEFIPTIDGQTGICYTHPEKLPGVSKDGIMRHFFHRPSKAYTTGTRKRRKVHTEEDGGETRWHKTGKTRPVLVNGTIKGFKKILVLYTNYGRQKKPEKTNWVMHQYHLGENEEERDGEFVLSKVFYQTQPRQCGSNIKDSLDDQSFVKQPFNYYSPTYMSFDQHVVANQQSGDNPAQLIPNLALQGEGSSFIQLATARK